MSGVLAGIVTAVAVLVTIMVFWDFSRTEYESSHWHDEEWTHGAGPWTAGDARDAAVGAFHREPAGTGRPSGQYDAAQGAQPGGTSQPAGEPQRGRYGAAAGPSRSSRRELKDWPVRSRLLLLVITPAVGVALMAFCVVRLADVLHGTAIHSASSSVRDRAILLAIAVGVAAIIVLVLTSWLTVVATRSVLKPIYQLRAGAREVGEVWLPEAIRRISGGFAESVPSNVKPIEPNSSDEIGDVAHAFNQMRSGMVRLTANQGARRNQLDAMFVRLAQRSQSLVERQVRLMESLEQVEQDGERLATLLKMNRIASRLHRNSQNLLVVSGHDLPSDWNQPIPLVNVIGAAVAEVEDYERVSVNEQPDIAVAGPAVNDVIHLLVELIENATSFSAWDMNVDISVHRLASGGIMVDVTDRGVGMASKELADENWRLENPSATDIDVPKCIGLFVVATLAARHGIKVRLQPAEFGGLTALTWLPDEVIVNLRAAPPARPGRHGNVRPRPVSHAQAADPGFAAADQQVSVARSPAPARSPEPMPSFTEAPDGSPGRRIPDTKSYPGPRPGRVPRWPGETSQDARTRGENRAPTAPEGSAAQPEVVIPLAEDISGKRSLPIFDSIESNWFRARNKASDSAAAVGRWSSSVDDGGNAARTVGSPSSGAPTAAGLPQRVPNANLLPGAIPNTTEPVLPNRSAAAAQDRLAGFQRGVSEARAASSEPAPWGREDES